MKIITIRQPWAHLIVKGSKNIENRTWRTSYRGPVLIHASLNVNRALCRKHKLDPSSVERGGVVGMAELRDCVSKHPSRWFFGPYGFVLQNRRPLPFIKWKGELGLREAPAKLLRQIPSRVLSAYRGRKPTKTRRASRLASKTTPKRPRRN